MAERGVGNPVTVRGCTFSTDLGGSGPDLVWGHGLTSSIAAEDEFPLAQGKDLPPYHTGETAPIDQAHGDHHVDHGGLR